MSNQKKRHTKKQQQKTTTMIYKPQHRKLKIAQQESELTIWGKLRCFGKVSWFCSTCDKHVDKS